MMHYGVLIRLYAMVCIAWTSMVSVALADASIWSGGAGQGLVGNPAAKFTITGGVANTTSQSTVINYFSDNGCTVLLTTLSTNGSYFFINPTNLVQASGVRIWGFDPTDAANTQSVNVIPMSDPNGGGVSLFNITPCFPVTCSVDKCVYSGAAIPVRLVSPPA